MFFCSHKLCAPETLGAAVRDKLLRPAESYRFGWARNVLASLHNGADVVMATRCERELKDPGVCSGECAKACEADAKLYATVEFEGLMANSTFSLILPGITPMSYRLAEALAFGAVPVIASDFVQLPFPSLLDWRRLAVRVSETQIHSLPERLRVMAGEGGRVADMRRAGTAAYEQCFATPGKMALCALEELEKRLRLVQPEI